MAKVKSELKDNCDNPDKWYKPDKRWVCPICMQLMRRPVYIKGESTKHVFCHSCIKKWFQINTTNPLTNKKLTKTPKLIKHAKIEKEIDKFIKMCQNYPLKLANEIFESEMGHLRPMIIRHRHLRAWINKQIEYILQMETNKKQAKFNNEENKNDDNINDENINDNKSNDNKINDDNSNDNNESNEDDFWANMGDRAKEQIDQAIARGQAAEQKNPQNSDQIRRDVQNEVGMITKITNAIAATYLKWKEALKEFWHEFKEEWKQAVKQAKEEWKLYGTVIGLSGFIGSYIAVKSGADLGVIIGCGVGGIGVGSVLLLSYIAGVALYNVFNQ